ncbi:hypothetical protein BBP40_000489 [Aspergillus hancockii]|nr:hypothetical protein BBP40_000489 [Aspergillus hancockii]
MPSPQLIKSPSATTRPASASEKRRDSALSNTHAWEPGVLKQLPGLGVLSLVGVLLCLVFNIVILVTSNGKPQNSWKIQPSVLLAISSAISTGLLRFALAEGAAITWWLKAINGCTVADLHRNWSFASSIWDVITQIKFFNILGLASIASVVIAIDSPLFQRATTIAVRPVQTNITLQDVEIAQLLPFGYTGVINGWMYQSVAQMTPAFQEVLTEYNAGRPMYLNHTGCENANCTTTVRAAGLALKCEAETRAEDFGRSLRGPHGDPVPSNYTGRTTGEFSVERVMFSTNFTFWTMNEPADFNLTAAYKDEKPCYSHIRINRCTMHHATLLYPIRLIDGEVEFTSSLENLGRSPETIAELDESVSYRFTKDNNVSTLGGVYLAANNLFKSEGLGQVTDHRWTLETSGMIAQDHLVSTNYTNICEDTWRDPTPKIVAELQKLMFRAALSVPYDASQPLPVGAATNRKVQQIQTVDVVKLKNTSVFEVDYGYMAAGAAVMGVCLVVVAATFYKWWKIGRPITMSPIEIAKAFKAPVLEGDGMNSDLNELLPLLGDRRVRYGEVRYRGDKKMVFPDEEVEPNESVQSRLELTHQHWAGVPRRDTPYV